MEVCSEKNVHEHAMSRVKKDLITDNNIEKVSKIYKIISDLTRLKIICALDNSELCVCDLCEVMNMSQSSISHQLIVLKKYNIVKCRREGKEVFYSLEDYHIKELINSTINHINEKR